MDITAWIESLQGLWADYWLHWAIFGLYLLATIVAAWVAGKLMKGLLPRLTARSTNTLDDRLAEAARVPVRYVVVALGLRMALEGLQNRIPAFVGEGIYAKEFGWGLHLAEALAILAFAALANALLKAAMDWYLHELATKSEATWDEQLLPLARRVMSLVIYFIAVSIILERFNYTITALVTTAGVASLAVALAAQETLSNMLGGFVILVDRPFRIGDVIELADGKMGEVVEIGLRSTRIKQFDGNALVVPNKDMASTRVINFALPTPMAAIRQTIGVSYDADIEHAKRVLVETIKAHPEILTDPEPGVWFTKFGASSLDLFMSAWVASYKDRFRVTDELNVAILKAYREAGIVIAYPQQDVHLFLEDAAPAKLPAEEIRARMGKDTN